MHTENKAVLPALTAANFVVGCSVLLVPGMLTQLAAAQKVSIPVAGWLITAGSIVMGLGAPLVAACTSRIDRRVLLVGALLLFAFGHTACALTQDFTMLLALRCLTLVAAAIVTPQAAATIGVLVPPEKRGAAVAAIFFGWSIASVVGMPAANLLALHFDWRAPFFAAACLSVLVALWVGGAVPKGLKVAPLSLHSWIQVAKHPVLIPVLLVTMISMAGQFVLFSFMVPTLEKGLLLGGYFIPALLLVYGVFGVLGNSLAVKFLPKLGANRVVLVALSLVAFGVLLWGLAFVLAGQVYWAMALLVLGNVFWGLGGFSANSAQQGRLMQADPTLASASVALNTSFLYLGQAIGTPAGAWLIATKGYGALPWLCLAFLMGSILLTWSAQNAGKNTENRI
jgi:MFS transporter, DHA1 family, inner membrane transport protein